ncbi:MAG: S9 family peptidase [Erysipelotrichaceae bacterium]|nr:S9 family peptidase [Erysipelotrichaceae bacterium]
MKPITIETMNDYRYLSALASNNEYLFFVDTMADLKNNDYSQRLHRYCIDSKEDKVIFEGKRADYAVLKDGRLLIRNNEKSDFIETSYSYLDDKGNLSPAFKLPLAVNAIKDFGDYYLASANVDIHCPNYFKASDDEKKAYHDNLKANADYLVLDEYPFFYNGAGFINGTRTGLYLINKKNYDITPLTRTNMDVEGYEVIGDKVYIQANEYTSLKDLFASIYVYDLKDNSLKLLVDNRNIYLRRLFQLKGEIYAIGSIRTCICGQDFFKLKGDMLESVLHTEWMLNNSIVTDSHYGKLSGMVSGTDCLYLLNTIDECSDIYSFDGASLKQLTKGYGSVDAIALMNDKLYALASQDMKLQELFAINDGKLAKLTALNEEVLSDKYVGVPERLNCFNVDEIHGFVIKPKDFDENGKYPLILDIHGGPKAAYGPAFIHEMQVWASMGYFVIYCNPHCSDGRGDDFSDYIKHYGTTDFDDLMAFVDKALETYPQIDKDRLAVTGGSYGGYMTNFIITHTDRFKVAASQRSISNRVADFYYSDYSYDVTHENGVPRDDEFIRMSWDRSPIKYADNIKTPTLFIQSTEDYRCPFPEALQLFSAMKFNGIEARLCGFKGENHELSRSGKPTHRIRRLQEISNWIDSHIKA